MASRIPSASAFIAGRPSLGAERENKKGSPQGILHRQRATSDGQRNLSYRQVRINEIPTPGLQFRGIICLFPTANRMIAKDCFHVSKGLNLCIDVEKMMSLTIPITKIVPVAIEVCKGADHSQSRSVIAIWVKVGDQMARLDGEGDASIFYKQSSKTKTITDSYT